MQLEIHSFHRMDNSLLAIGIGIGTLAILGSALLVFLFDRRRQRVEEMNAQLIMQVQNQRQQLANIVANVPGIVWEAWGKPDDSTQKINFVSEHVEAMLGYSVEEWLGSPNFWLTIVHPDDQERAAQEAAAIFESRKAGASQFRWLTQDGRVVWVLAQSMVICDEAGTPIGMRGVTTNITERKQAEEELQKLYQQVQTFNVELERQVQERTGQLQQSLDFAAVLKRITDKIRESLDESQILQTAIQELADVLKVDYCFAALYDADRTVATISYEYSQANLGSALGQLIPMAEVPNVYDKLLGGDYVESYEPGPNQYLAAKLLCPIFDDQGPIAHIAVFNQTYRVFSETEIRLVQQVANQCAIALRQAQLYQAAQTQVEELARLNGLKDDFLSTVSHELRTPVSNIKMAIQMLKVAMNQAGILASDPSQPQAKPNKLVRYLQILQDECEREISLINDLLDLQRLEQGVQPLALAAIQLQAWLPQVVEPFQERARDRQQHLQIELCPLIPPLVSDPSSLGRIVAELLNNACKYTPPGEEITVKAGVVPAEPFWKKSEMLQLCVSNSGVEIPAHERSRIFEKFYRIPSADPWQRGGTGLGLALVQKLITHLGGSIRVESACAQTSFTVELPLQRIESVSTVGLT